MRYLSRHLACERQQGSVAIEAALSIAFILVPLLAFILLFGRYFWYYNAAQKAAHDAALYLAVAPLTDIRSNDAGNLANVIMDSGLDDMDQLTVATKGQSAFCLYPTAYPNVLMPLSCATNARPAAVRATISITVNDPFLAPFTEPVFGYEGLPITAAATLPYAGQ